MLKHPRPPASFCQGSQGRGMRPHAVCSRSAFALPPIWSYMYAKHTMDDPPSSPFDGDYDCTRDRTEPESLQKLIALISREFINAILEAPRHFIW